LNGPVKLAMATHSVDSFTVENIDYRDNLHENNPRRQEPQRFLMDRSSRLRA
jgi:hypothetical protein